MVNVISHVAGKIDIFIISDLKLKVFLIKRDCIFLHFMKFIIIIDDKNYGL